eukprot:6465226-Amphidinium_carterae.1
MDVDLEIEVISVCMLSMRGLTMRDTLLRDKRDHQSGTIKHVFGKKYWDELISRFPLPDNEVVSMLQLKSQKPTTELFKCYVQFCNHPYNRAPLRMYCETVGVVTEADVKLMLTALRSMRWQDLNQRLCGLAICRCLQRCNAMEKYPELMSACRGDMDRLFVQTRVSYVLRLCLEAWVSTTRTGLLPGEWCSLHADALYCIFPRAETETLLGMDDNDAVILENKSAVKAVVNSSVCGSRIFAGTVKKILNIEVTKAIEKHVENLNSAPVSEASILKHLRECVETLKNIECVDMLPMKREVSIRYRGIAFECTVSSLSEQAELQIRAWVRGAATIVELLSELLAESQLSADEDADLPNHLVEEQTVVGAKQARRTLKHHIDTLDEVNGEAIRVLALSSNAALAASCSTSVATNNSLAGLSWRMFDSSSELEKGHWIESRTEGKLKLHGKELKSVDRYFVIDEMLMQHLTGESSGEQTMTAFKRKCLLDPGVGGDLTEASTRADGFIIDDSFKWQSSSIQGEIRAATSWLKSLSEGQPIGMKELATTSFLREVLTLLNAFLKVTRDVEVPKSADDPEGEQIESQEVSTGRSAMTILVADLDDTTKRDEAFALCSTLRHMLTTEEAKKLETIRLQGLKSADTTMRSLKGKSEKVDAKSKKKKGEAQSSMEALAMAALGMSS